MIRFLLGLALGAVLVFNASEDSCDQRIKGVFTPDNYRAMQLERESNKIALKKS